MVNKLESSAAIGSDSTSLKKTDALEIPKNTLEFVVTRDFNAEMEAFSEKYGIFKKAAKAEDRRKWGAPHTEEYCKVAEETFRSIPQFDKSKQRETENRNMYHIVSYTEAFWRYRESIVDIWADLDILENDSSAVTAENCVNLVSKAYKSFEKLNDMFYNDFPNEDDKYSVILNEIFQPTVETISKVSQKLSEEERNQIADRLKDFVIGQQEFSMSFFDRTRGIAEAIIDIKGFKGLNDVAAIMENLLEKDYTRREESEFSYIDSTFLEFDESSDDWILHGSLVNYVGSREWDDEVKIQVAEFLCNFMEMDSPGCLGSYVEAFQNLGVETSLQPLLNNLKNENIVVQRMSAEVLYRLELGKIGITSEEGIRYFDKLYKLAKEDDPDFFVKLYSEGGAYVQRVDTKGRIGVFNSNQSLLGSFNIDLNSDESELEVPVVEITSKDVFLPKADETPDERKIRESMLQIYLSQYGRIYDEMREKTGINLNSLDLYQQGWFIVYYSKVDEQGRMDLLNFLNRYGEVGLKAFLSLDYGESADEVLKYANSSENVEPAQRELFRQFNSISNRAIEWRQIFDQLNEGAEYNFAPEIHEAFIRKSSEYFRAALLVEKGEGGDVKMEELLHSMRSVAFALQELKQLYSKDSNLVLVNRVSQNEYMDNEKTELVEDARTTWTLSNSKTGARVVITSRPVGTAHLGDGKSGGSARLNFKVTSPDKEYECRIGIDLENVPTEVGETKVLSLDLGTGNIDREAEVYPTQRVGRVLGLVEGSEGGHNAKSFSPAATDHFEGLARKFTDFMNEKY